MIRAFCLPCLRAGIFAFKRLAQSRTRKEAASIKIYTVSEVAKMLKISKNTVYTLIYSGKLKASRITAQRGFRIREEALEEFLKQEEGRVG